MLDWFFLSCTDAKRAACSTHARRGCVWDGKKWQRTGLTSHTAQTSDPWFALFIVVTTGLRRASLLVAVLHGTHAFFVFLLLPALTLPEPVHTKLLEQFPCHRAQELKETVHNFCTKTTTTKNKKNNSNKTKKRKINTATAGGNNLPQTWFRCRVLVLQSSTAIWSKYNSSKTSGRMLTHRKSNTSKGQLIDRPTRRQHKVSFRSL